MRTQRTIHLGKNSGAFVIFHGVKIYLTLAKKAFLYLEGDN